MALAVANLRRSSMGRRLLAIRANPQAASSLGISPVMAKAYAFAIAAAMAAVCGSLLEAQLSYADFGLFGSQASIQTVLSTTVGGIGFVPGAITGAAGGARRDHVERAFPGGFSFELGHHCRGRPDPAGCCSSHLTASFRSRSVSSACSGPC